MSISDPMGPFKPTSITEFRDASGRQSFMLNVYIDGNDRSVHVTLDEIQVAINNQAIVDQLKENNKAISGTLSHLSKHVENLWRAIAVNSGEDLRKFKHKMDGG